MWKLNFRKSKATYAYCMHFWSSHSKNGWPNACICIYFFTLLSQSSFSLRKDFYFTSRGKLQLNEKGNGSFCLYLKCFSLVWIRSIYIRKSVHWLWMSESRQLRVFDSWSAKIEQQEILDLSCTLKYQESGNDSDLLLFVFLNYWKR